MLDAIINLKDNFSNTLKAVDNTVKDFSKTTRAMGRDIERTGKNISKVGSGLTKSLTVPIVGVGLASLKLGMDFEKTMSEVKAVTGATGTEFEELQAKAREMGKNTTKSSNEAAEAMAYMGMAGWKQKDIIAGIEPVLRLAEAGNIDLARASDLVTDSMSAMGIEVQDLEGYLDIVAQAARSSNTDVDAMMEAYLKVGGVLKGLDVSLEESAVSLGMLANAGLKGAEGGGKLSAILTNLTAPAGRAKKALDELGFTAFDNEGNFKGLDNILFELRDTLKELNPEQQNMFKSMIAGKENIDGLNALLNGLDDSYEELTDEIGKSKGALKTMADIMNDNTAGSISQLMSAIQELGLKIYDVLRPAFIKVIEFAKKVTDSLDKMSPEMQDKIVKFAMFAAAIGPVLLVIGKLTSKIGGSIKFFGELGGKITKAGGLLKYLTSPAMLVVGAIVAIISIGVLLYKNWDTIKSKAEEIFPGIGEGIKNAFGGMKEIFSNIIDIVIPILVDGFELMKLSISMALDFIGQIWDAHGETIIDIVTGLWGVISTAFSASFELIYGIVMVGVELIKLLWSLFGDTIISLAQTAWETIGSVISGALEIIKGIINLVLGVISGNWGKAWEGMKTVFSGIFKGLAGIAKGAMNGVISVINGAIGGLNKIQIPDWVPGVGGKGINIPLIPRLAKGTNHWNGGIVQVHEEGGEIIDLPNGSRVYPHDKTVSMAREQGRKESETKGNTSVTVNIHGMTIREETDIDKVASAIVKKIKDTSDNTP